MTTVESLTCPTCGAPLSISGNETEVTCQFCGNVVRVASAKAAPPPTPPPAPQIIVQPVSYVPASSRSVAAAYAVRRSSSCAYTVVMLILVFGLIGVVLVVGGTYGGNFGAFLDSILGHGTNVVVTFGGKGTGVGLWDNARHMAVDGKGYVYVADEKNGRIQRFDANGKYVSYWDLTRKNNNGPDCLAADRSGDVWVCQDWSLLKYDGATGKLLGTYAGPTINYSPALIRNAAATSEGGIVSDADSGSDDVLLKFDANGSVTASYPKLIRAQEPQTNMGVESAVDGLGNMYFLETISDVDGINEIVLTYDANGKFINRFGNHGRGADQFYSPQAIALDAQSRIYIGDSGNVKVFDNTGRYLNSYTLPGTFYTYSLGFSPDGGNLYALCMNNTDNEQTQVYKIQIPNQNAGKS